MQSQKVTDRRQKVTGTKMLKGSSRVDKWAHPWWQNNFLSKPNWSEDSLVAFHLGWYNLNEYLHWLWMPGQCCPAGVHCTQPVCAACLAPVPSPGHCRICQQASGSARSSRSYQGLQQAKREKRKQQMRQVEQRKGTWTHFLIMDIDDMRFLGAIKAGIHPPRITQRANVQFSVAVKATDRWGKPAQA